MEPVPLPVASSDVSTLLLPAKAVPKPAAVNRALLAHLTPRRGAAPTNTNTEQKTTLIKN